jgi:two-component system phosphate regulon sensor histidine kinase PhoR
MSRKKLVWQIFPPFLVIIVCALIAVTWTISREIESFHLRQTTKDLETRAILASRLLTGPTSLTNPEQVDRLCKELGHSTATRLTVVLRDGTVIGDSEGQPGQMDNHANRPEITLALQGTTGTATRFSRTLRQNMLYVAIPIIEQGLVAGSMRAALSIAELEQTLSKIILKLVGGGLAVALIAALVALTVSRRIIRPLRELQQGAERFAQGDLQKRLPISEVTEIGGLAETMNTMAAQLDERLRTVIRQRNEQDAVLTSMIEGVIAIDTNQVVLRINRAAAHLLQIDLAKAVGRHISEVTRKVDLQRFVEHSLSSSDPVEAELTILHRGEERYLQAHGTPLLGALGQQIGALVVVHDVTRLHRLENLRRDFVANVSHELKTPITAIKGAVETLQDGAMNNPQDGRHFLEIAGRQADRLNALVEDLLSLSRLERGTETEEIRLEKQGLQPILEAAVQACATAAEAGKVQVQLSCSEPLTARANALLLEQAIINLVDNAIKYSEAEGVVTVEGRQDGEQVLIKVQDRGQGIAKVHLPRLFERFYRADAARSRTVGGTGLGLAIVKHIVQAHRGKVTVHSIPGEGSVFTISLPVS